MAATNFDALTRALAGSTSRRQTLKAFIAGAGGLLGLSSLSTVLATTDDLEACVKKGGKCKVSGDCCAGECKKNKCVCFSAGRECVKNADCCSGTCKKNKCA